MPDPKPTLELVWYPPNPNDPNGKPLRISAQLRGNLSGHRYALYWGDGTFITGNGSFTYAHEYATTGLYSITARATSGNKDILGRTVAVVRADWEPQVTIEPEGGEDWTRYVLTFPTDETVLPTRWLVTWPGDTEATEYWAKPGDQVTTVLDAGTWGIPAEDVHGQQTTTAQVEVASPYDPNWESVRRAEADPSGMTLGFKLVSVQNKTILVDPGDGTAPIEIASPKKDQVVDHKYGKTGNYMAEVKYKDGSGTPLKNLVKVPWT